MRLEISKDTSNILRGIAILCIVLHNFCHWQGVCENEFTFAASNITDLTSSIKSGILNAVWDIISFFGHYGVEIFVFLSGYGLAKKHSVSIPRFGGYMRHNISKLWMLMIPGLICYALIPFIPSHDFGYTAHQSFFTLTFLSHVSGNVMGNIAYGPYWYFGLTLQLYIFYFVLVHKQKDSMLLLWSCIVIGLQLIIIHVAGAGSALLDQLRANLFIAVPTFCLGVYVARHPIELNPRSWHCYGLSAFVAAIFLSVCPHPTAWLVSSLFWPLALIWICTLLPRPVKMLMLNVGILSPWIFVAHPVIRQLFYGFLPIKDEYLRWSYLVLYLIAAIALAYIMQRTVAYVRLRYPGVLQRRNGKLRQ